MKPGVVLLRAAAVVCTSLALTACGGPMTEEEAAALEAEASRAEAVEPEALASQEAEVGACTTWSAYSWDGSSIACGVRFSCGTYCDEYGNCEVNPAAYRQESSYRVCFDEYGNYTHTEYQYRRGAFLYCGC
jgi:hypothetical protein